MDKTAAELHVDWVVASDIATFPAKLSAETEDGQYEILLALLAAEFRKLRIHPLQ